MVEIVTHFYLDRTIEEDRLRLLTASRMGLEWYGVLAFVQDNRGWFKEIYY